MLAMLTAVGNIDVASIAVESTLMSGDCCKALINTCTKHYDVRDVCLGERVGRR